MTRQGSSFGFQLRVAIFGFQLGVAIFWFSAKSCHFFVFQKCQNYDDGDDFDDDDDVKEEERMGLPSYKKLLQ